MDKVQFGWGLFIAIGMSIAAVTLIAAGAWPLAILCLVFAGIAVYAGRQD